MLHQSVISVLCINERNFRLIENTKRTPQMVYAAIVEILKRKLLSLRGEQSKALSKVHS